MKPRLLDGYLFGEDGQGTGFHSRYRFVNAAGLSAQLLHRLVPLLDGTRDIEEIAQATGIEPADVRAIVDMMTEAGLIADSSAVYPECGLDAQWRALAWTRAPRGSLAAERLNAVRIGVTTGVDPTVLTDALRLHGMKAVSVSDLSGPALSGMSHLVAIAAGENPSHFEEVDAWSRERSVPWVRVVLEPERVRVGPLFLGQDAACYTCLTTRMLSASTAGTELHRYLFRKRSTTETTDAGWLPGSLYLAAGFASLELLKIALGMQTQLAGFEVDVNVWTLECHQRPVLRVPTCHCCNPECPPVLYAPRAHRTNPS